MRWQDIDISTVAPGTGTRIFIKPASFGVEQRVEASEKATAMGMGARMEIHSAHTEYYADPEVPIGQMSVYVSRQYKAWPTYDMTLKTPDADYVLPLTREEL